MSEQWWNSLRHGGLLIESSRLSLLRDSPPAALTSPVTGRLRGDVTRLVTATAEARRVWLDTVLETVCRLGTTDGAEWLKGQDVSTEWSRRGAAGELLKPRRVLRGPHEATLPVFVDDEPRLGVGRGRRSVSRVLEWLRASQQRLALLTNHAQLRLIYAGPDYDAWAEWDTSLWFQEGAPTPQVEALQWLLSPEALVPPRPGARAPLLEAIEQSRRGQAELSSSLGERVRRAVEELIQAYAEPLAALQGGDATKRAIYVAATRVVMRMVVVLFAEARELLPRENPRYETSYGLQALRATLDRVSGVARGRRRAHHGAWPRVLGLFRLVFAGSHHPELPIPRYGGVLFAPGDAQAVDPIVQALAVFEDSEHGPNDQTVWTILDQLCSTQMRVPIGRRMIPVAAPVDFSDLSSEYIGILYEGLLDYELRRAGDDQPQVFLNVGDQPVLPLSRLEEMSDAELGNLLDKLRTTRLAAAAGNDEEEDDSDAAEDGEEDTVLEDTEVDPAVGDAEAELIAQDASALAEVDTSVGDELETEFEPDAATDASLVNDERARAWAIRAVKAAGLVPRPRGRRPEALAPWEEAVAAAARLLVGRVVQPGEWFLVLWGGTRKGSGTFYTRPQLAVPTVHRTLGPLAFDPPAGGDEAPLAAWIPKAPDVILALKVCDPAVGSGSFAAASLRFLADALWRSLLHHRWLAEEDDRLVVNVVGIEPPPWFSECVRDLPVTAGDAEAHVRARLRRVVVERCIYGVDLDPLAIELARLSLWVETMDRSLPFEFLDHRLKVGNALVGCWFDRFRDYPVMAWMREGGDVNHTNFVHHFRTSSSRAGGAGESGRRRGDKWTAAIKEWLNRRVRPALVSWIVGQGSLFGDIAGRTPEGLHVEAVALLHQMEAIPLHEPDERAAFYRERLQGSPAFQRLQEAFDTWCALWFWPANRLETAPLPDTFAEPASDAIQVVRQLKDRHRFFHWELEFPDVFAARGSGFHAIVGNPPWEIQKPNSKEFFSDIDPLYRGYGKQEAIRHQKAYFSSNAAVESAWIAYAAHYKALSNWNKNTAGPFGAPNGGADETFSFGRGQGTLHARWLAKRRGGSSYADAAHPFQHQGSADINTYKMFLEQSHALLRQGGRLGMITPSGVYTDKGSTALRTLFLDRCRWEWLFGFENRERIFDIHRSFKFGPVIVAKGGRTEAVRAAFMRHDLRDWEEAERHIVFYPRRQVERFSPNTKAILEVRNRRDLEVLEKIYANSVLLGDKGPDGWEVRYATEFHMTADSKLFPPRPWWEAQGYQPDEYGRWIKSNIEPRVAPIADCSSPVDSKIAVDVAVPVYQGVMVGQLEANRARWMRGSGNRAVWEKGLRPGSPFSPQFLVAAQSVPHGLQSRYLFRNIARTTDVRTMIGTVAPAFPAGHSLGVLLMPLSILWTVCANLNSLVYDFALRARIGGTNLSWAFLEETPALAPSEALTTIALRLGATTPLFAEDWLRLAPRSIGWKRQWAVTSTERLRLRAMMDAIAAELYGLGWEGLAWILRDCDHPSQWVCSQPFARRLDPKGFWRVDKERPPELRHTILTLLALHDLKAFISVHGSVDVGIQAFCGQNGGDGWMLPEAVRLSDYGLGRDDRAMQPQLVSARMGERFLPWQLKQTPEESWAECERHARNLLGAEGYARLQSEIAGAAPSSQTPERIASVASAPRGGGLFDSEE